MSLTTLLLLTGFLFFMAVALTALLLATRSADEGYEDDAGFHGGRRKSNSLFAPRLVKPLLQEQFKIMLMPDVPVSALILAPGMSPRPPRMDLIGFEGDGVNASTALLPANLPISSLHLQLAAAGAPTSKRKRKGARKDGPSDGSQMGFPGFAA